MGMRDLISERSGKTAPGVDQLRELDGLLEPSDSASTAPAAAFPSAIPGSGRARSLLGQRVDQHVDMGFAIEQVGGRRPWPLLADPELTGWVAREHWRSIRPSPTGPGFIRIVYKPGDAIRARDLEHIPETARERRSKAL
jgi:hypothetical protein